MRFLNGVVVGFLLSIGLAYWHDRNVAALPDAAARQLVNWDEFGRSASTAGDWVREQFEEIAGSLRRT